MSSSVMNMGWEKIFRFTNESGKFLYQIVEINSTMEKRGRFEGLELSIHPI